MYHLSFSNGEIYKNIKISTNILVFFFATSIFAFILVFDEFMAYAIYENVDA